MGAMEGIPIQLVIVVVIGVAALAILLGWIALAGDTDPTLRNLDVEPETVTVTGEGRITDTVSFKLYIYDNEGNEVDDAVVTFSGSLEDKVVERVNSGDSVEVTVALASGQDTGSITVKAEKGGGMGSCETTIIIMRG